jgi:glycosyltransferase involved in cell wall biosynthesis
VTNSDANGTGEDVAIVVATRDAAATIAVALESIARAVADAVAHATRAASGTGEVITAEVVVVDGGSDDATATLVAALPRVRWLRQQGTGLAAARNQAVAATTAPLVAFCDADDAWTRDALRLRRDALARVPAAWGATGRVRFFDRAVAGGGGEDVAAPPRRRAGSEHVGVTPGALLVRRDTFARVGPFDETLTIGADADWIVRAQRLLGPPIDVGAVVLEKGLRAGSLSTDVDTYRRELLTVARRLLADPDLRGRR